MRYIVLVLCALMSFTPAFAAEGFFAQIKTVENGGQSLLVEGDIEGYGPRTSVIVGVSGVQNESGAALPFTALTPGARVWVKCNGYFLESLPLQMQGKAQVTLLADAVAGFEATVLDAHAHDTHLHLVVSANLPGYGDTQVSVSVSALVDAAGQPVSDVQPGAKVFVEYDGGFLESYPLQLNHAVRVVVR